MLLNIRERTIRKNCIKNIRLIYTLFRFKICFDDRKSESKRASLFKHKFCKTIDRLRRCEMKFSIVHKKNSFFKILTT